MVRDCLIAVILAGASLVTTGCIGPNPYTRIDLHRDLSQDTLQRYQKEWDGLAERTGEAHMVRLEHSNWWPLGLVIFHRDATVMRMAGPEGVTYHVMSGQGFGPLCVLYSVSTSAVYNERGERLSGMRMYNSLYGHLLMIHETDALLPGGRSERSTSMHLLHHVLALDMMDGHNYLSFATIPNPLGFSWMSSMHGAEQPGSTAPLK